MSKDSNGSKTAIGTLIGVGVGFLAGILLAPKSGKETRKDIKDVAVRTKQQSADLIKKLNSQLVSTLKIAEDRLKTTKESASKELIAAMEAAKRARDKTREVLSAFHEGDADDNDLSKAINEANKALEHLKLYLHKEK